MQCYWQWLVSMLMSTFVCEMVMMVTIAVGGSLENYFAVAFAVVVAIASVLRMVPPPSPIWIRSRCHLGHLHCQCHPIPVVLVAAAHDHCSLHRPCLSSMKRDLSTAPWDSDPCLATIVLAFCLLRSHHHRCRRHGHCRRLQHLLGASRCCLHHCQCRFSQIRRWLRSRIRACYWWTPCVHVGRRLAKSLLDRCTICSLLHHHDGHRCRWFRCDSTASLWQCLPLRLLLSQ
mmetsp:Transcript_20410/g.58049  ORF Transcript_20410/g.58049 Transcript_20410/m.58049 type:complete len:231 (-) Transcript_20410:256-948(-)